MLLIQAAHPVLGQVTVAVAQPAIQARYRPDRILIKPKTGTPADAMARVHKRQGTRVRGAFPALENLQVITVPEGAKVEEILAQYRQSGLVEFAEPDYLLRASAIPNDPRYADGTLWSLHNTGQRGGLADADIDAPESWDILNSAGNIVVAIIDGGVRYTHEDLAANMWVNPGEVPNNGRDDDGNGIIDDVYGFNAVTNTGDPKDETGHGTHVAGIIGAVGNNGRGVVGVAWKVKIMALKFMDASGFGATSDAIQCIDYARTKGAKIINASWGGTDNSLALRTAISRARTAGMIFVAAAGNAGVDNDVTPDYPSSFDLDNVVSVGASTRTDALADFSDFGAKSVDLVAPGSTIYSTWHTSDSAYSYLSGTSMAAPCVSGALALLAARFPNDTYKQLIDRLLAATDSLPSLAAKCVSGGRLNLQRALSANVIANFTASTSMGSPPLTVNFQDASLGGVLRRGWNFGDGTAPSFELSPTHTFAAEGTFTVTLTLTGSDGATSVKTRVISVVANYQMTSADFNWIDPSGMTRLILTDNGTSPAQRLSFPFVFYGQPYDQLYVGANGVISFLNQGLSTTSNTDLPLASSPNAVICPYWDNLNPAAGGSVRIGTVGGAPNRRMVISWVSVPRNSSSAALTFQAVLSEGTHQILFQYLDVQPSTSRGAARGATVGLENETGTVAAKYTFDGSPALLRNSQTLLFIPQSTGGMVVTPSANLAASGSAGGPFSPSAQTYTIENTSQATFHWTMGHIQNWVQLSATDGVLEPGQRAEVTVSLADSAGLLKVGSYSDTIAFINSDTGHGNTVRTVGLAINGTSGTLTVAPDSGLTSNGTLGGPFNPASQVYTLINTGDATIGWAASTAQNWLTLSESAGTLAAGDSTTVTVLINANAATLEAGSYDAAVAFTNTTNGLGNDARNVALRISPPPPVQLTLEKTLSEGQYRLRVTGEVGKAYRIESSTDLQNWTALFTNAISTTGYFEFTDLASGSLGPKFYRAVLVQ